MSLWLENFHTLNKPVKSGPQTLPSSFLPGTFSKDNVRPVFQYLCV